MCNHLVNFTETDQQVKEGAKKVEQQTDGQYKLSSGKLSKIEGL